MKAKPIIVIISSLLITVSSIWAVKTGYFKRAVIFLLKQSAVVSLPSGSRYSAYYYPATPEWLLISVKPTSLNGYKKFGFLRFDGTGDSNLLDPDKNPPGTSPDSEYKPIKQVTIKPDSTDNYLKFGDVLIANSSSKEINIDEIMSSPLGLQFSPKKSGPAILMYHTHLTEAFAAPGDVTYRVSEDLRSDNLSLNLAAVGDTIESTVESAFGSNNVIHITQNHENPTFNKSYERSLVTAQKYLKKYPTIGMVLDVHRDSMINSEGVKYAPVTEINGRQAAQMMIIVGSGNDQQKNSHWKDNLRFAVTLQKKLQEKYPDLCRPIYVKNSRYNSHVSSGALLLEMGSCGNTLDQVKYTGELLGSVLSEIITEYTK